MSYEDLMFPAAYRYRDETEEIPKVVTKSNSTKSIKPIPKIYYILIFIILLILAYTFV